MCFMHIFLYTHKAITYKSNQSFLLHLFFLESLYSLDLVLNVTNI